LLPLIKGTGLDTTVYLLFANGQRRRLPGEGHSRTERALRRANRIAERSLRRDYKVGRRNLELFEKTA
jgi:hypothetical protein